MIMTTAEYKDAAAKNSREIRLKADISGVEVTGKYLISAAVEEVINAGNELTLGCACSSKLELEMRMPEPAVALNGATVRPFCGVVTNDGVEWVPLGVYYVSDVSSATNYRTVSVTAYDAMSKLESPYIPNITQWPAKIKDIAEDICEQSGVGLDTGVIWPEYEIPSGELAGSYTCREMVGFIAGMMGKNACFKREYDGEGLDCLTFKWYTDCGAMIPPGLQYQNGLGRLHDKDIVINSITTGAEDNIITVGEGRGISFTNPFITQEAANEIYEAVAGFSYAPVKMKWRGDPAIEAGDIVLAEDQSGNSLTVPVMGQKIVISGGLYAEITAPGSSDTSVAMGKSPTAAALNKIYAGLSAAFKDATEKISGAKGGYFKIITDEQGIPQAWQIMDTPEETPHTKLWRFNQNGLAWSGNGGGSFKNIAITMDGEISANAITAGTLSAERIAVENYGEENEAALESYIRFADGMITLGREGSGIYLRIENEKISFISGIGTEGEKTVAYFSNNSLEIVDVEQIRFGNFGFLPRQNGNLSFTKVI